MSFQPDPNTKKTMNPTRRVPIDFESVAKESGLTRGKLCHSPHFGWCVQNMQGADGPDIGAVTPPAMQPSETRIAVEDGHWCFYA